MKYLSQNSLFKPMVDKMSQTQLVFFFYSLYVYLPLVIVSNAMGMAHLKIINASRGPIYEYENLKRKLYNCNANIYFNRQCSRKQLIPNYAKIKIPNTSPAARFTQRQTHKLRIQDEIKYLYIKH